MTEDELADFLNKLNDLASDYGLVVGGYQQIEDFERNWVEVKEKG